MRIHSVVCADDGYIQKRSIGFLWSKEGHVYGRLRGQLLLNIDMRTEGIPLGGWKAAWLSMLHEEGLASVQACIKNWEKELRIDAPPPLAAPAFLEELMSRGITVLAVDCDLTLIDIHTGGHWAGPMEDLTPRVRPFFKELLPAAHQAGLRLGIATFSSQPELIHSLVKVRGHEIMEPRLLRSWRGCPLSQSEEGSLQASGLKVETMLRCQRAV